MRVTKSVVFGLVGLVSLVSTANATKITGKPALAKRQPMATVTVTSDGCTAVCWDVIAFGGDIATRCDASCDSSDFTSMPTTSTSTTTSTTTVTGEVPTTTSTSTEVISSSSSDCVYTCSADYELGDFDCGFECGGSPSTSMPVTPTSTEAVLAQRTVISAVDGDCTAVCWDLMPAPSKAARVANFEARENVQAHQVREARLARKFGGLVARDGQSTSSLALAREELELRLTLCLYLATVTVTSIPEYCTAGPESSISSTVAGAPTILPMQAPQEAGVSAVLAQASSALSAAQQEQAVATANVSVAPSALSEASALSLAASSMLSQVVSEASVSSAEAATAGSAATVSATTTASSIASTVTTAFTNVTSTTSKTTTASATTTGSVVVSAAGPTISTSFPTAGAAREYTVSTGLVFSLLVGLAANVAFLI
ncbi:hypothetical protein BDR22DRAFT_912413 [Usnea florida]